MLKTITQVRNNFWDMLREFQPELAKDFRVKKRQNEYCTDIRCMFVDHVDYLRSDGQITEALANKVTL